MKFSIRDLLWLTVIVALSLGWWLDRQRLAYDGAKLADSGAKLAASVAKLEAENKQLQLQVELGAIDLAVERQALEQYKLKTLLASPKSQAPPPNPPNK